MFPLVLSGLSLLSYYHSFLLTPFLPPAFSFILSQSPLHTPLILSTTPLIDGRIFILADPAAIGISCPLKTFEDPLTINILVV